MGPVSHLFSRSGFGGGLSREALLFSGIGPTEKLLRAKPTFDSPGLSPTVAENMVGYALSSALSCSGSVERAVAVTSMG